MVRERGLEPPRFLGHKILSLARLPVPPLPHEERADEWAISSFSKIAYLTEKPRARCSVEGECKHTRPVPGGLFTGSTQVL